MHEDVLIPRRLVGGFLRSVVLGLSIVLDEVAIGHWPEFDEGVNWDLEVLLALLGLRFWWLHGLLRLSICS